MPTRIEVDVPRLFALWADDTLTRAEVARELGLTAGQLTAASARYALPPRARRQRAFSIIDPTPEEIEERKAALPPRDRDGEPDRVEIRQYAYDGRCCAFVGVEP